VLQNSSRFNYEAAVFICRLEEPDLRKRNVNGLQGANQAFQAIAS
jgi:hypothetical protein